MQSIKAKKILWDYTSLLEKRRHEIMNADVYHPLHFGEADMVLNLSDEILKESGGDWKSLADIFKAGKRAVSLLNSYIEKGASFNQETTLCGNSVIRNITRAKENGYLIEMHYIGLDSVEIAKERVAKRVSQGGHGVAEADIERRYIASLEAFWRVLPLCNLVAVYDNTEDFRRFAIYKDGSLVRLSHKVPGWFTRKE